MLAYEEQLYYFDKNTLGDITAIRDKDGNVVATYAYDAWGNCTVRNFTSDSIGNINPFRYRGYYYDTETGFYYLQTRYYDPTICRFINADLSLALLFLGHKGRVYVCRIGEFITRIFFEG